MSDDRPFIDQGVEDLKEIVEQLRHELSYRTARSARRLREEIDPDYSINRTRDCCVYVIELKEAVREDAAFATKNVKARSDRPCLYVGSTSLTPEERLEQHRTGIKSSRIVRNFCCGLRREFFERYAPMTRAEAEQEEQELARLLRREGYGVWQE